MAKRSIFTIVNNNYIHFAQALAESIFRNSPGQDFFIILLDDKEEYLNFDPRIKIIRAEDLRIEDFVHRAFYYDITELATSIKPDVFLHMSDLGYDSVIYFDPDIYLYENLGDLYSLIEDNNIVVTPHLPAPINTPDGLRPNELDILRTGVYNLGFIGIHLTDESIRFLRWWASRLKYYSFESYDSGLYTDQKWINIAATMFSGLRVLDTPGYNLAYWNLHAHKVTSNKDKHFVDGKKLIFFHFSGFKIDAEQISKNQNRYSFTDKPELKVIFDGYRSEVLKFYNKKRSLVYKYANFSTGKSISSFQRSTYFMIYCKKNLTFNPFDCDWHGIIDQAVASEDAVKIKIHTTDSLSRYVKSKLIRSSARLMVRRGMGVNRSFSSVIHNIHLMTNRLNYSNLLSILILTGED